MEVLEMHAYVTYVPTMITTVNFTAIHVIGSIIRTIGNNQSVWVQLIGSDVKKISIVLLADLTIPWSGSSTYLLYAR